MSKKQKSAVKKYYEGSFDGKTIAVKRVPHDKMLPTSVRLEDALQKLDHCNVIKFLFYKNVNHYRFFYFEQCHASLDQHFLKNGDPQKYWGPIPSPIVGVVQLARGLEYIHAMKLVHGNIQPQNIFIWMDESFPDDDEMKIKSVRLKWGDFGISADGVDAEWLAPELQTIFDKYGETVVLESCTTASDLFSAGCIFGYLMTGGEHLFGSSNSEIKDNIQIYNPINFDKVPVSMSELIHKMVASRPEERMAAKYTVLQISSIHAKLQEKENLIFSLCMKNKLNRDQIERLLLEGVSINCIDQHGSSPLTCLLQNPSAYKQEDFIRIVFLLFQERTNKKESWESTNGLNVLHLLCKYYSRFDLPKIVRLLIRHGVDVNSRDVDGENALFYLLQNVNPFIMFRVAKILLRHGVQLYRKRFTDRFRKIFYRTREYHGLHNLIHMLEEDVTLGWHINCSSCIQILSFEKAERRRIIHHMKFSDVRIALDMVLHALKSLANVTRDNDCENSLEWLRSESQDFYSSMSEISNQVGFGNERNIIENFDCTKHEEFLRRLHNIAEEIRAEDTVKELELSLLLPFDEIRNYDKEDKFKEEKEEWDTVLHSWSHIVNSSTTGYFLFKDSRDGMYNTDRCIHNCHGQLSLQ